MDWNEAIQQLAIDKAKAEKAKPTFEDAIRERLAKAKPLVSLPNGAAMNNPRGKAIGTANAGNYLTQSLNAAKEVQALEAKLIADGFTRTGPDMWEKVAIRDQEKFFHEDLIEPATRDEIEEFIAAELRHEVFIGYQDAANYVVLAGPYDNHQIAAFAFLKVWKLFEADKSLQMSFPLDKRRQDLLTTFDMPATAKRKGAYGKI